MVISVIYKGTRDKYDFTGILKFSRFSARLISNGRELHKWAQLN